MGHFLLHSTEAKKFSRIWSQACTLQRWSLRNLASISPLMEAKPVGMGMFSKNIYLSAIVSNLLNVTTFNMLVLSYANIILVLLNEVYNIRITTFEISQHQRKTLKIRLKILKCILVHILTFWFNWLCTLHALCRISGHPTEVLHPLWQTMKGPNNMPEYDKKRLTFLCQNTYTFQSYIFTFQIA